MIERNAGLPAERRIEFRVGVHLGDVVEEADGDLMGDGVNIAALPWLKHAAQQDGPANPSPMPSSMRDYGPSSGSTGCEVMRPSRLHGEKTGSRFGSKPKGEREMPK